MSKKKHRYQPDPDEELALESYDRNLDEIQRRTSAVDVLPDGRKQMRVVNPDQLIDALIDNVSAHDHQPDQAIVDELVRRVEGARAK